MKKTLVHEISLRDRISDIIDEYRDPIIRNLGPVRAHEKIVESLIKAVGETQNYSGPECRLADFQPFLFIHCPDGRIKLQSGYGNVPFVYVNHCGGCGAASSVPVEEI